MAHGAEGTDVGAGELLDALADLAPSGEQRTGGLAVPTEWFRWLPLGGVSAMSIMALAQPVTTVEPVPAWVAVDRRFGERLAAVDQVRAGERTLRIGFLFVAGRTEDAAGRRRRVFHPLVTMPVRVHRPPLSEAHLVSTGDPEVTELVTDGDVRADLERRMEFGGGALDGVPAVVPPALLARLSRLRAFAVEVAAAAGLPATRLVPADASPDDFMRRDGLVVAAGLAVYARHETGGVGRAVSLRAWADAHGDTGTPAAHTRTAFHDLYGLARPEVRGRPEPAADPPAELGSPFVLTPAQRDAVLRSREEPVTLVSGAPGTGKSHTLVAVACDALSRGESVLVAAKSDATVDALLGLLERAPGPTPVVFGSNERRQALAARLAAGRLQPADRATVAAHRATAEDAAARRDDLRHAMVALLTAESFLTAGDTPSVGSGGDAWTGARGGPSAEPGAGRFGGVGVGGGPAEALARARRTAPAFFPGGPDRLDALLAPPGTGFGEPGLSLDLAGDSGIADIRAGGDGLGTAGREVAGSAGAGVGGPDGPVVVRRDQVAGDEVLEEAGRLLDRVYAPARWWWPRRKARIALRRLARLAGAEPGASPDDLAAALGVARAARDAANLAAAGGLAFGARWTDLEVADAHVRDAVARWLAVESRSARRLTSRTLKEVAGLATALRSGRAARRSQLERLRGTDLTRPLPLWVGTLADIEDLLPPQPAMFDLVMLDEASAIDQPLAVPALLRARRAVIAGDPRQLRHVTFVSDERMRAVAAAHGIDRDPVLTATMDVRRNSTFDVAAGVTPVVTLDEHFRSAPHLVEFVARRLYGGEVRVATRAPSTESKDCVTVIRLDGDRGEDGVVSAEVDRTIDELRRLRREGARSVGVVTPFRAQADALEGAVLRAFGADDVEAMDLRVGTVHAFQGNERDVVVASLGLGPGAPAASWRFAEDPHLFAVFATRARRRLTLLVSADPPAGGLVADYLAQVDEPPPRPRPAGAVSERAVAVAADLRLAGLDATAGYPTGRHVVDICVATAGRDVAIETGVHPAGPEAHVDRHLALRRAGWRILEAHASRHPDRARLVLDLAHALTH